MPLGVIDLPDGDDYFVGSYVVDWDSAANPRGSFPLVNGGPRMASVSLEFGQIDFTAMRLLVGHQYVTQTCGDLALGDWSDVSVFTAAQTTQAFSVPTAQTSKQFWRILAP